MNDIHKYKVYRGTEFVATCKYIEDSAALVAIIGKGGTIRYGTKIVVWNEGTEAQSAGESYDFVTETVLARIRAQGLRS